MLSLLPLAAGLLVLVERTHTRIDPAAEWGTVLLGAGMTAPFGLIFYRAAYMLIRPASLSLSPQGLAIELAGVANQWSWDRVSDLRYGGRGRGLLFGPSSLSGSYHGIDPIWKVGLDQIRTLVLDAKSRWGDAAVSPVVTAPGKTPVISWLMIGAAAFMVVGLVIVVFDGGHMHRSVSAMGGAAVPVRGPASLRR
ncbi:MAG: hypothetical protein WA840_00120 [Caulobacteraceae bacterium]